MNKRYFVIGFLFLFLFAIFTLIVKVDKLDQFDFDTTVRLQDHIPQRVDAAFSILSLIGSVEVITIFLFATVIYYRWKIIPIAFAYFGGLGIELIGKIFLPHPGPPYMFARYHLGFSFPSSYVHTLHSYPSGHVYRTTFVIILWLLACFALTKSDSVRLIVLIIALFCIAIMVISRISLGEHWTTDVIGGALLGAALAFGSVSLRQNRK